MTKRIGFCCKWVDPNAATLTRKQLMTSEALLNKKGTTLTALRKLNKPEQYDKIYSITQYNTETLWRVLRWIAKQPEAMRLFRVSSNFIPASTLAEFAWVHTDPAFLDMLTKGLSGVRAFADQHGIRMCTHPGQFTNLCALDKDIILRSIEDLEYHGQLAQLMGYGDSWHSSGFAINIHANSRQDPGLKQIRRIIANDLSSTVRNLITLENDEFSCNVDDFVNAGVHEDVALVMDIHHHWVATKGQYISPQDPRCAAFASSWRGVRPLGHYSLPTPDYLPPNSSTTVQPDYQTLVQIKGISSKTLRTHSNRCWNSASNEWAVEHLEWMDIEVEAKGKNLASRDLYDTAVKLGAI